MALFFCAWIFMGQVAPIQVGDPVPYINLPDQHGQPHAMERDAKWLVIAFDKPGASIAQKWLKKDARLSEMGVVFVLDASHIKEKMRNRVVMPRMRKIEQQVLIALDPEFRDQFPRQAKQLTALELSDSGSVLAIHFIDSPERINALAGL